MIDAPRVLIHVQHLMGIGHLRRSMILAGALTVVTLSIGEFNLTWMLHTPYLKTLPVGLADSYASMRLEIASAYTLVFFILIVPLLMAMQWASARAQRIAK